MRTTLAALVLGFVVLSAIPLDAVAAGNPFQIALFAPIQLVPESQSVNVFRFNIIYGSNTEMHGLDIGLVNRTTSGKSTALQLGFVGWSEGSFSGIQWNSVNFTRENFKGIQWGLVNYAKSARGLQFGFLNYTENMYGVQIGLLNFIKNGKFLPFFPIVNFSF